ncbi:MAG TPA: ADOP family duplicated permease [Gemmatimonadaceae bacterium]|jgi:predicted permease
MVRHRREGVRDIVGLIVRRPDPIRREADDELASVIEERTARLVERGMPLEEARAEAIRCIGGSLSDARDRVRQSATRRERVMSILEWLDGVRADLRYAMRGLAREPLFSAFAVLTLALGIGANAAMFDIVDKLLVRGPAGVRDANRVVRLYWSMQQPAGETTTMAAFDPHVYANLLVEARDFSGLAMYSDPYPGRVLGEGTGARIVSSATATANLMSVLGARPALGRFFTADEQLPESHALVAVLGYGVWQGDFAGDSTIVGRTVTISSRKYTVVGVAPKSFTGAGLNRVDVWLPLPTATGPASRHWGQGSSSGPAIVARLRPGVTFDDASHDATRAFQTSYDGGDKRMAAGKISVAPLHFGPDGTESTEASIARWLAGLAAIVLLAACANIVNLLLVRASRQRRELAVRMALGASRARLIRLLLAGALLLATIGGAAGLAVAFVTGTVVRRVLLPDVDWASGPVDERALFVSLGIALVTGIVIGVLPALRAGRTNVPAALKAGAREGHGNRSTLRNVLLLAQAAFAMLLLVGAGLFVRSLEHVRHLDLGVQADSVVMVQLRRQLIPPQATDSDRALEQRRRDMFASAMLERIAASPAVAHAAAAVGTPFNNAYAIPLHLPGRDSLPRMTGGFGDPDVSAVSADYFATMGTRLLRGRVFENSDRAGSEPVAVVSETMARVLWPGADALGQCLLVGRSKSCTRVVGIVQDVRRSRIRENPLMHYYLPLAQSTLDSPDLLVRPRGSISAAIPALKALLQHIDPTITYVAAGTLQERIDPQTRTWRIGAMMFSLFAGLALVVAAVGTFSVVAYLVQQRQHEIGVRIALGARATDVVTLMVRGAVGVTVLGVVTGTVLALIAGRFAEPLLFETSARDPVVVGGVAAVLVVVSLLASAIPALSAGRVDPMTALRED